MMTDILKGFALMRNKIKLYRLNTKHDSVGGVILSWELAAETWANVEFKKEYSSKIGDLVRHYRVYAIKIRNNNTKFLCKGMKVVFNFMREEKAAYISRITKYENKSYLHFEAIEKIAADKDPEKQ